MTVFNWKKASLILTSLFVFLILLKYIDTITEEYVPTTYEKKLISYFKEIALQSEYDGNPEKIIKWEQPMVLFIFKEQEFKPQMSIIKKTIEEINRLVTDGFKIVITNNLSRSNSILYLCKKEKVAELDRFFYEILTKDIDYDISGLAYSEFDTKTNVIDKSLIFINSEYTFEVQESTIREEITQSLGLAFDSKMYSNSVFYKDKFNQEIRIKEYSQFDRDIIRLLYHPRMKPGLDSIGLEQVIKKILKSEKD